MDSEFVSYGPEFVDLGHIAAEAWLQGHSFPSSSHRASISRGLITAIFKAYRQSGGAVDLQNIIYYIMGHVICFIGMF